MARVRYHSGVWERNRSDPGFAAAATFKLDSSAVGSALKGEPLPVGAPGAEGGAGRLVPGQGRRRGGSIDAGGSKAPVNRSAEVDHITAEAGVMTALAAGGAGEVGGGRGAKASPVKERSLHFQSGSNAAQALHAEPQPASAPSTLLVGSAAMKARHYHTHLAGNTVGSLLAMTQPPQGQGERDGPRAAGVPVSEVRRTSISSASSAGGARVLAAPHPPPSPASAHAHAQAAARPGTAQAAGLAARAGTEMAALTRPGTADPAASFTTVTRLSYAGPGAHGGGGPAPTPLDKEPPRRRYGAAPAGVNNPYRKTSIY